MDNTRIFILSFDNKIIEVFRNILKSESYNLVVPNSIPTFFEKNDIVVLEDKFLNVEEISKEFKNSLKNTYVIYLTDSIDSARNIGFGNFYADDFLIKSQLTDAVILRCIRHIEESQKLRQEIINQEKRYESLFYHAIDAGFYLSPNFEVENVNQAFINLFGLKRGNLSKIPFIDLFNNPEEYELLKKDFAAGANNINREISFKRFNSLQKFPGFLKIAVLKEESISTGRYISGFHGTVQNIAYKKRLQTIKENSERLAMIHRLSRALAHEIRNPLTNITLATGQLEDELVDNDEGILYLDIIKRSSSLIDDLITKLLRSSAKKEFIFSEYDLVKILKSVIDQSADRAKMEHIHLISDLETESLPYLCDHEKLQLAISNLVVNAIESIPVNTNGQVIIGLYQEEEFICIYIEDTGIGMTAEEKKSLFDPFYTKKNKGRGLGLTATLAIILEHNAHIEVESALNIGTTFTIMLPRHVNQNQLV